MSDLAATAQKNSKSNATGQARERSAARSQRDAIQTAKKQAGLLNDSEPQTLAQRTQQRLKQQQMQRQRNLETIFEQAQELSSGDDAADELDPDWLYQFCRLAEQINSGSMQRLWSHIFAREIAHPGSFSVKALTLLNTLTLRDANLFQRACGLSSLIGQSHTGKIVSGCRCNGGFAGLFSSDKQWAIALSQFGLTYPALMTLVDNGLLFANELESGEFPTDNATLLRYNGEKLMLRALRTGTKLIYYRLTPIGMELSQLLPEHVDSKYLHALQQTLSQAFEITG